MGAYLSQPVKEKESSDGGNARVKFGTSAMQGWRTSMEVRLFLRFLFLGLSCYCLVSTFFLLFTPPPPFLLTRAHLCMIWKTL